LGRIVLSAEGSNSFYSSRRRHTRSKRDWSSDVCSSDLTNLQNQINQLTADNQVVSITHNLGRYPDVQVLYWEYGLGTVPLEEQPEGISFDGTAPETIPIKVVHPSRKRMQIHVPIDYAMTNPTIKQIKNNEY